MASLSKNRSNGTYQIQFYTDDGKRKSIRLGRVDKRAAEGVCRHVGNLVTAKAAGQQPPKETAVWLSEIGGTLRDRLAAVGLVESDRRLTVAAFLSDWLSDKKAAGFKPTSLLAWGQTAAELSAMFADRPLTALAHADGEAFRDKLRVRGLRMTTIHKRLAHAKAMLEDAVRLGHLTVNPFRHVRQRQGDPSERRAYVPVADIQRVIEHCPNVWWRLLVALARFGGLRTPSEPFSLTWGDVDWERNRLTVPSPKTEGRGKPHRIIPLFPLLRPHLEAAFEATAEGDVFVFPEEYRRRAEGSGGWNGANVRTTLGKIVRRAGVESWPRIWHSLRASCESDLAQSFPLAVVAKWLGNTPSVALRHYVDPTDAAFTAAAEWTPGGAKCGAMAVRNAVLSAHDGDCPEVTNTEETAEKLDSRHLGTVYVSPRHSNERECMGIEPTESLVQTPHRF